MNLTQNLQRTQYPTFITSLSDLSGREFREVVRLLCRTDLWFLLRYVLRREDLETQVAKPDWLFERVREVQANPDGYLDLWAREHYKSTIITFALTIQDILAHYGDDPLPGKYEPTFAIFSHTRPIAKAFLAQIRQELAWNTNLKEWFPDILWDNPEREAPTWSLDNGIVLKRQSNPKEATVEAWGLVDGQPTSKHFNRKIYDDVVTRESVTNPDMIKKTTEAWELSLNLGAGEDTIDRNIGTRYHFADTWGEIIKRKAAIPRIYPCTADGTVEGTPVLRSREFLDDRYRKMGSYTFGSQMLQNPVADDTQGFRREDIRYFDDPENSKHMNRYILVDPANEKRKKSDYTAIAVIGLGPDKNLYLLDAYRDKLNLGQRARLVIDLHQKWKPRAVGYEKYGKDSDIQHIQHIQKEDNYRFDIQELGGTQLSKRDRIRRLIPWVERHEFYLPRSLNRTNYEGRTEDLINVLVDEELMGFPVALHDDLGDAISRIFDMNMVWPKIVKQHKSERYGDSGRRHSWMGA